MSDKLPRDPAQLDAFLDSVAFVYPNLNDTFSYACADAERLCMDGSGENNQAALVEVWSKYGHAGIVAYCARVRGYAPSVTEALTPEYHEAWESLDGWTYESD